jgi:hypothetical protein
MPVIAEPLVATTAMGIPVAGKPDPPLVEAGVQFFVMSKNT